MSRRPSFFEKHGGFDTPQETFGLAQALRQRAGRHQVAVVVRTTLLLARTVKWANGGVVDGQGVPDTLVRGLVMSRPACGRPEGVDQQADVRRRPDDVVRAVKAGFVAGLFNVRILQLLPRGCQDSLHQCRRRRHGIKLPDLRELGQEGRGHPVSRSGRPLVCSALQRGSLTAMPAWPATGQR